LIEVVAHVSVEVFGKLATATVGITASCVTVMLVAAVQPFVPVTVTA
jgi:hypothetical protein